MSVESRSCWWQWGRVLLISTVLIMTIVLPRWLFIPEKTVAIGDIPPFPLESYQRILIFAPHCDDETLGTAGLVQAAIRSNAELRVVIATNGDGYLFATMQDFKKIYPRPTDFIRMGELRQQESLAALAVLGLSPEKVYFLSYPDRGSPSLWVDNWSRQDPYRSPFSQDTQSPYLLTYDPTAVYSGEDYLADVQAILDDFRPDLVVYPHPDDVHPDHWGLNAFSRLAITLKKHVDPTFTPLQLTYLVHRPDFPEPRGLLPQTSLVPPPALYQISPDWLRWDLQAADVDIKGQAVQKYRSQLPLLRGLMDSFIRSNELFAPVGSQQMMTMYLGNPNDPSTWKDATGQGLEPIQRDPVGDFITRDAFPGGDLVAVFTALDKNGNLQTCLQARGDILKELIYNLRIKVLHNNGMKLFSFRTGEVLSGQLAAEHAGKYACGTIYAAELENPWAVYLGASVEAGGRIMDEAAWQMAFIRSR